MADYGHKGTAELLLEDGADIEAREETGKTPLHLALGYMDVVEILLAMGRTSTPKTITETRR